MILALKILVGVHLIDVSRWPDLIDDGGIVIGCAQDAILYLGILETLIEFLADELLSGEAHLTVQLVPILVHLILFEKVLHVKLRHSLLALGRHLSVERWTHQADP